MSTALTVGGWFAQGFIKTLIEKASDRAIQLLAQHHDLNLNKLHNSLLITRAILNKAENRPWDNKTILAHLMPQLKDAAYDAEDLLEEFEYQVLKRKIEGGGGSDKASDSNSFAFTSVRKLFDDAGTRLKEIQEKLFDDAGTRLKEIQEKLDDIASNMEKIMKLSSSDDGGRQLDVQSEGRETSSFLTEKVVFGRDEELNKLVQLLSGSADESGSRDNSLSVLPLVGIGGVGKTTLAQLVYNHESVVKYFELRIWVCVSDYFNVKRITKEIIESATKKEPSDLKNLNSLQMILKEEVASKKFLLVLDDAWGEDRKEWEKLLAPLRFGVWGSKVIVTTRLPNVACIVGTMNEIQLDGLKSGDYWELFKNCAFGSLNPEEHPKLVVIGRNIAGKLKGSPLAAKTLGSLLQSNVSEEHWNNIMENEIWQLPQNNNDIIPVLQLSYQYLPGHLKECFAFCSLFPKDHQFDEYELIRIWMAEGFVAAQGNMRMEDLGSNYFHELVSRSFFQKSQDSYSYEMHDLIHDVARRISAGEFYRIDDDEQAQFWRYYVIRHLSIGRSTLTKFSGYDKLRTLLRYSFMPEVKNNVLPHDLFEKLKNIRVLILRSCGMGELPESIGDLIHLRYLDISYNYEIRCLPESLCGLYNLQVLILWCLRLQSLPQGMRKLINLRQLHAKEKLISKICGVGKLTCLQELPVFKVSKDDGHKVAELGGLTQLHARLRITNLENVESKEEASEAKLNNKKNLEALELVWTSDQDTNLEGNELLMLDEVLEGLQPHHALKRMKIKRYSGVKSPSWLEKEGLSNLENLELGNCKRWEDLSHVGQLPHLEVLRIKNLSATKRIGHELCGATGNNWFPNIKCIFLTDMPVCEYLPSFEQMPNLKILRITRLSAMKKIGRELFGATYESKGFPRLEELVFSGMPALEELSWADGKELFPCLRQFEIVGCPKLKGLPPLPPSLVQLNLEQLGLTELPALWEGNDGNINSVTSSLARLTISECPNLKNLEEGLLSHCLPNIKSICIEECGELMWLPVKGFKELTSLENLVILSCPKLMSMTKDGDIRLLLPPSIERLGISKCGNLSKSLPGCLHNLTSLTHLVIDNCPYIVCLPRPPPFRLQVLGISYCEELRSIEGLGLLKSLETLIIQGCPNLLLNEGEEGSSSSLTQLVIDDAALIKFSHLRNRLPSIHEIRIKFCPQEVMFDGEGELLRSLASLRTLTFYHCKNLQSLPLELHTLPSLQLLEIDECPQIQSLPEKGLPTSLTDLHFTGCHPILKKQLENHLAELMCSGRYNQVPGFYRPLDLRDLMKNLCLERF